MANVEYKSDVPVVGTIHINDSILKDKNIFMSKAEADRYGISYLYKEHKPLIVNLMGAPGSGKSTGSAYIFAMLKMAGINAELVTEFAKDKTWEKNHAALSNQLYMLGKQSFRLSKCEPYVDVIVTDSPLILNILYNYNPILGETYNKLVVDVFNSTFNFNVYVNRVKPYNPIGRNQSEVESDALNSKLRTILDDYNIPFIEIYGDRTGYDKVVDHVLAILQNNK